MEYNEHMGVIKLNSLKRRYDRYKIFDIKKILCKNVPNIGINILHDQNHKNGLILETMNTKTSKLRKATFQYTAPRIFNNLPKGLRT